MKNAPFIYGVTVNSNGFTNRSAEIAKLKSNLLSGINTAIISPRRWGKSSLVSRVINEIRQEKTPVFTVSIDLYTMGTEKEFLEFFAREVLKSSSGKWEEWLKNGKEFFQKLVPKFSVGVDPFTDFSLSFDWEELQKHSDEVLNLPELIAKKKGIPFIICLDEFQNLSNFTEYPTLEKKMRACWQRQEYVTYCIYGSKRHMMTDIFNNPSKPFYRFGDLMILPKIETSSWITYLTEQFAASKKEIEPEIAVAIPQIMKNHSWYVQQLAHYTWNVSHRKAGKAELNKALNELIYGNAPLYQKETESLSPTQINLLKAVTKGETQLTSTRVMIEYALGTPRNVSKNKQILIENDVIEEAASGYEFLDPAFELWFRKQFFGISFTYQGQH